MKHAARDSTYDQHSFEVCLEFGGIADGESYSGQVCPACQGGPSKEKSLSVSNNGGILLWNCHRASCLFRGASALLAAYRKPDSGTKRPNRNSYVRVAPLDPQAIKDMARRLRVTDFDVVAAGIGRVEADAEAYRGRFSFSIFGPDSRKRGASYRSYEGKTPKNIVSLFTDDAIALAWYKFKRRTKHLLVFEDQASAIRVAPYHHAVSLLGVNLSESKIEEIIENADDYESVILCLDRDATYEAIKLQLKYRQRLPKLRVRGLGCDVKDMSDEDFHAFLSDLT